jgi:hypothetical protein
LAIYDAGTAIMRRGIKNGLTLAPMPQVIRQRIQYFEGSGRKNLEGGRKLRWPKSASKKERFYSQKEAIRRLPPSLQIGINP